MTWTGWLAFGLVAAAVAAVLFTVEIRQQRGLNRRINAALSEQRCPKCGGQYSKWRGARGDSHAVGVNYEFIDTVRVKCERCGCVVDAFWSNEHAELWLDNV